MWKYKGGGYLPGVPARDLTDEEMDEAERAEPGIKSAGLYQHERPQAAEMAPKADSKQPVKEE